jgi:hypothetical protein
VLSVEKLADRFAEHHPLAVDMCPPPPTRVPLTAPPFRHAADRVTKFGAKAQWAQPPLHPRCAGSAAGHKPPSHSLKHS